MAGGMPNVDTFPVKSASMELSDGTRLEMDSSLMKQALQYSPTPGVPELVAWGKGLQERVHSPPPLPSDVGRDCLITNGSQDGLCKAFEALVSEEDNVLVEMPAYPGALAAVKPMNCNIIPVNTDRHGMDPQSLGDVMSSWSPADTQDPNSKIPKIMYLIPNGGNPTGHTLTEERKRKIYEIAQKYNILILEDDPYFYLQFQKPYVPSMLSMDTDGRVIRFDSFSKLISSGMRLGLVSGPKPVLDRISLHMQASVMHASGLSQVALLLVLQHWGYEGFEKHVENVSEFYRRRKDLCLAAVEKHMTGLADWSEPSGGMFLWLKLHVADTYKLITVKAREKGVLFVPGNAFMLDSSQPCPYVRASYSMSTAEQMDKAFERLADLVREEQNS